MEEEYWEKKIDEGGRHWATGNSGFVGEKAAMKKRRKRE